MADGAKPATMHRACGRVLMLVVLAPQRIHPSRNAAGPDGCSAESGAGKALLRGHTSRSAEDAKEAPRVQQGVSPWCNHTGSNAAGSPMEDRPGCLGPPWLRMMMWMAMVLISMVVVT